MATLTQLMNSSTNFKNVKPVDREFVENNFHSLQIAYTGFLDQLAYAVYTQDEPYQQYIFVLDVATMQVVSG